MNYDLAKELVKSCLHDLLEQNGTTGISISESTVVVGSGAVLDSIGVVSLIVDIEQRLEMDHDVSVTLANEKAMSQKNSPFRTVGVLAEHICKTIEEVQAA